MTYLFLTTTLLDTFIFPILQRGNWGSEKFKCIYFILLITHERTKNLYHFKSLHLWLSQTVSMKSFFRNSEEQHYCLENSGYKKSSQNSYFRRQKQHRELSWSQDQARMGTSEFLCGLFWWLSPLVVRVWAHQHFPLINTANHPFLYGYLLSCP